MNDDVAIIGISALFSAAKDMPSYWQNIFNKVDAVHAAPDEWAYPYFDPNSKENNRIYTRLGGFIGKLAAFNPVEFGIVPNSVDGGEPDQYLALKLARDALWDAGYESRPFNREKTGIIIGRGTYPNRGNSNLIQHGMIVDQTLELLGEICPNLDEATLLNIRKNLQASLPAFNAETAPGLVPNIMTGRIANRLDLMGPNYIVDAACASSLVAVDLAIGELASGRCDMVLAGGVQASVPPVIAMIFCQLGALSRSNIRPFDANANGTLLGEGLGMLVLKRLKEARRDGDRIYAVIKGVGTSSDGKALGLMAPRLEGEILALQRAYANTGIDSATIGLLEAHGTGIALGDRTEVQALSQYFGQREGLLPTCALGSVKSMIGHCLPAAGVAGLIKTALALYHKVLPPTLCDGVNSNLGLEQTPFYINTEVRPWIHGLPNSPRRAAVNAFGFGGINAHAVLEEDTESQPKDLKILHQDWPTELLVFSGIDRPKLLDCINQILQLLKSQPEISLANLAYTLSRLDIGTHRLAIIACDLKDLETKLNFAVEKLADPNKQRIQARNGIYYSETSHKGKIAFLFPGEGAQYTNMLADLCLYFPKVREWFDLLDETFYPERAYPPSRIIFPPPTCLSAAAQKLTETQLYAQDVGVEIVFTASRALLELLNQFNINCDVMVGHSAGETTALTASGIVRLKDKSELIAAMRRLNRIYQDLKASDSIPKGALLTIGNIDSNTLKQYLEKLPGRLHLAMDNCPNQVVIFGDESHIHDAMRYFKAVGGICSLLPYGRANHTPLNQAVANALVSFYASLDMGAAQTPLYSCAICEAFPSEPEAIRDLAAKQWISRVKFRETIAKLYDLGVTTYIEVGPRGNLTAFVDDILRGRNYLALASNSQRKSGLEQIQNLLARLFVDRISVNFTPLYQLRDLVPVNLDKAFNLSHLNQKLNPTLKLTMPIARLEPELVQTVKNKLLLQTDSRPIVEQTDIDKLKVDKQSANGSGELQSTVNRDRSLPNIERSVTVAFDSQVTVSSTVEVPISSVPPVKTAPTVSSRVSEATADTQLSILFAHFDLMQEFLVSQERVANAMFSNGEEFNSLVIPHYELPTSTGESAWPFLGDILESDYEHLYSVRRFDINQDIFLQDHTIGGQLSQIHPELLPLPVIPFTISLEMLAEAAVYLVGGNKVAIGFHNLRGYRWLALDRGEIVLYIQAQRQSTQDERTGDVRVQLFQSGTSDPSTRHLVFEGSVRLADRYPSAPHTMEFHLEQPAASRWSDAELYRTGMFHGPLFQGVKHIRQWGKEGIEADLEVIGINDFFSHIENPVFQTDAGLLDNTGQLVGYWVSDLFGRCDFNVFPYSVRAIHLYAPPLPPGTSILGRGSIEFIGNQFTEANMDLLDRSGKVIIRVESWQDRYFEIPSHYYECRLHPQTSYLSRPWMQTETQLVCRRIDPFTENFFNDSWGIWLRVLVHLMLNQKERDFWYGLSEKGRRRQDWLLGRIAAKDAIRQWAKQNFGLQLAPVDIEVFATDLGKPLVCCPELEAVSPIPDISISHSQGYVIAALANSNQRIGVDLQRLNRIHADDLLSGAFSSSEIELLEKIPLSQTEKQTIVVSFWCAKEAIAKAIGTGLEGNPRQFQVSFYSHKDKQVTIAHAGLFFQVKLWYT
ncbi:polyketide synthase dehydratase domain-containing protein, partial [Planktothrix sp. FACHB-1355]